MYAAQASVGSSLPVCLILGGGLAGLFTALKLAPLPCLVLSPRLLGDGTSSAWAQGGLAAAIEEGDSPEAHAADTVLAGAGLVDADVALGMAREARARVLDLLSLGVPFDRSLTGDLIPSREAAHGARRIVRVKGDQAGKAIMGALIATVRNAPHIKVLEGWLAQALTVEASGAVSGVVARDQQGLGHAHHFSSRAIVLATGGAGALYTITTNPVEARGQGISLAHSIGAATRHLEFVQFHPTAMDFGLDPAPLATESLRGEGATLINKAGERFMLGLHPDAELAPRDIVARAVFAEVVAGRGAYLDARAAIGENFSSLFPAVYAACQAQGLDPATQPIPVAPAAHYHMGGVRTDAQGRTDIPNLWAVGEVASTGVHGANRLASNSLLEAVVFGARTAQDILGRSTLKEIVMSDVAETLPAGIILAEEKQLLRRLRQSMQTDVGVSRNATALTRACNQLESIAHQANSAPLQHMAKLAGLMARAALERTESCGAHYRSDTIEQTHESAA
jgi:L-aspartate oxidase